MPLILGTNSIKDTGYEVANSLRFNRADSSKLIKQPSSVGNGYKGTLSVWIKRSGIGTAQQIIGQQSSGYARMYINSSDQLRIYGNSSAENNEFDLKTNRLFRDVSAWYHIVFAWDNTQSTASLRNKIFVNGVQETSFATETYNAQNAQIGGGFFVNSNNLGISSTSSSDFFDGYMAEVVGIEGTTYDATSFGEFNSDSPTIWQPIDVSGLTFGTNGFYLDFEDSSNLGNDANGGTDFTETNLAATDQSTDTCTNNFATLNPLVKAPSSITFSEGNLKAVHPGSWTGVPATIGVQSGRWYWECKITTGNSANTFTGICVEDINFNDSTVYDETGMITYFANGRKTVDGTETASFFSSLATNDIVGVALDLDSGTRTVTFTKNGSASGSAVNLTSNFDNKFIFPVGIGNSSSATANWEFNFGSPPYSISSGNSDGNGYGNFEYSVPSGYYALNTKNLAEFG